MFGRTIRALALVAMIMAVAAPAFADLGSHSTKHVYVNVTPTIAVSGHNDNIDLGDVMLGQFYMEIEWRIDANTEAVRFMVAVSELYKGDDCDEDPYVDPIPVDMYAGVDLYADDATPINGQSYNLEYTDKPTDIYGCNAYETVERTYESSQYNHFSQPIWTKITWEQVDPEQPQGQYSGYVELWAYVVPSL